MNTFQFSRPYSYGLHAEYDILKFLMFGFLSKRKIEDLISVSYIHTFDLKDINYIYFKFECL